MSSLLESAAALRCAGLLARRGERVAVVEATSGGLVGASLLACPGASRFFVSTCVVYSGKGYREFLPPDVLQASGVMDRKHNYANEKNYIESKRLFADEVAQRMRQHLKVDWCVVESGTAGPEFYVPGVKRAFTAVGVAGPGDVLDVGVWTDSSTSSAGTRATNMWRFRDFALERLELAIASAPPAVAAKL